jgi:hypothetical protein
MTAPKPDLFLITGIPGTGKTCYGNEFASKFGFAHYDLEDRQTLSRFATFADLISEMLFLNRNVVVTWGFNPEDAPSLELLRQLRNAGFKWIWFDGNRPAALQAFRKRGDVSEQALVAQTERIERTKIVERLKPTIINSFDDLGHFKPAAQLLEEIRRA